jgi:hypothetical protein
MPTTPGMTGESGESGIVIVDLTWLPGPDWIPDLGPDGLLDFSNADESGLIAAIFTGV